MKSKIRWIVHETKKSLITFIFAQRKNANELNEKKYIYFCLKVCLFNVLSWGFVMLCTDYTTCCVHCVLGREETNGVFFLNEKENDIVVGVEIEWKVCRFARIVIAARFCASKRIKRWNEPTHFGAVCFATQKFWRKTFKKCFMNDIPLQVVERILLPRLN